MTDHTFKTVKLILHESFTPFCDFLMTSLTSHLYMLSVEIESRFVVVEFLYFPTFIAMTFRTIGHPKFFKLPIVVVFMAA